MGRADLASASVRGRSDGHVKRRGKEEERVPSAPHPIEGSSGWTCGGCGEQNASSFEFCSTCGVINGTVRFLLENVMR